MELVWNIIYLILIFGSSLIAAIIASKKGYRDMLWFLVPLFAGFVNYLFSPVLLIVIFLLKDLNVLQSQLDHATLQIEKQKTSPESVTDAFVDADDVAVLSRKLDNTRKFGNWLGGGLLLAALFMMLFLAF